ncbi:hydrolase [Paenibacillus stellifer]|uniref:Hydrolase n=1 Tax=Paenibacillus stellifer TaxID=169760 RepID=A0A089LRQ8_9BACL|nr:amidohydrolase [Paenibacillus stellifer]AIQ63587.1 hydrolase [Paenibacillus stellifer]
MSKVTKRRDVAGLAERLSAIRQELHRYPELSGEEFETTRRIKGWLEEAGITIASYPLRTGVVAEIGGKLGGPVIALRADIDALPIQEETHLPFASSVPGKMHACGHDFHTAAILGAAYLLKEREDELQGTVRLLFQPAEEKGIGAGQIIESGAFEGVRAVLGLHNKPDLPVGTIGITGGPLMAAADGFKVEVKGKGSHAAVPDAGLDPIVAAAHIITAVQSIVSRNVSAHDRAVVSVTKLSGGTALNVIPEYAVLEGTIRTFDEGVRAHVLERFEQVAVGVAAALGTSASVHCSVGPPPVANDQVLAELAWEEAERLGLEPVVPVPSLASEDFAVYQKEVPGLFVFFGTSGPQEWHHPAFELDERALPLAADFFANLAFRTLNNESNMIGRNLK